MKELSQLRQEIDTLDHEIMKLFSQRMECVKQVGEYKRAHGIAVIDNTRWNAVLSNKIELAKSMGLDTSMVTDIYNRIHQAAIELENTLQ